jgi:anti-anti-sigma factor
VVEVSGILNWQNAPRLRLAVPGVEEAVALLLDLRGVTRIDSAGTAAVIATYLQADRDGMALALVASGYVEALLDRAGLGLVIPVFSNSGLAHKWLETAGHRAG